MTASVLPQTRMRVPEFLAWAKAQSAGRFELIDGAVVAMSPERLRHNLVKLEVAVALRQAIRAADLCCIVFTDGATVAINDHTAREPDASVQCGGSVHVDSMVLEAPVIVVEVVAPSSERGDTGAKLIEYFSVGSIQHYLIVDADKRAIVHHRRNQGGEIETHILHEGGHVNLAPPGLNVPVSVLLGPRLPGAATSEAHS